VRIINHAVLAGAAAATGMLGMGALAGRAALPGLIVVAACALVGAALWAQMVEGSSRLSRPFGYYGSILGGLAGAGLAAAVLGQPASLLLGAAAAMAPWIQAIGRLRCLVQGCCHGSPTTAENGIRVRNAHSRVVQLARLEGVPIHATQLYSIAGNLAIGALLVRLWFLQAPLCLIAGLYLILAGLARFMEEAYRGEPQTRILWGLPIYQHLSVLSVLGGMALSAVPSAPAPEPASLADPVLLAASLGAGLVHGFAMGADFPESQRRFARLSG
jgi:prolipoprotein diacylglyceryltransferase